MHTSRCRPVLTAAAALIAALLMVPSVVQPASAATHPGSDPSEITAVGSQVFFAATTAAHGRELWVTNAKAAGTHEVADINPTPGVGSNPNELTALGFEIKDTKEGAGWKLKR